MTDLIKILLDLLPWWGWLMIAAVVVAAVYRYLGKEAAIAAAVSLLGIILFKSGRQTGQEDTKKEAKVQDEKRAEVVTKTADEVRADVAVEQHEHPERVRDDDGWRRD